MFLFKKPVLCEWSERSLSLKTNGAVVWGAILGKRCGQESFFLGVQGGVKVSGIEVGVSGIGIREWVLGLKVQGLRCLV